MLRASIFLLALLAAGAYAHVKPYDHPHVGFLHPEELIALLAISGVSLLLLGYRFIRGRT